MSRSRIAVEKSGTPRIGDLFLLRATIVPYAGAGWPLSYEAREVRHGFLANCRILYASEALRAGTEPLIETMRSRAVSTVLERSRTVEEGGLFLSMSIGVRGYMTTNIERVFKECGLSHLLVVSGCQVTLIFYSLHILLRRILSLFRTLCLLVDMPLVANILSLTGAMAFVLFVGIEGASLRAGLATIFVVLSRASDRGGGLFNSILAAFFLLALIWPGCYLEPGVQLTFAALLGIACAATLHGRAGVLSYLAVNIYAGIFTSLVVLFWMNTLSLTGFLLNPFLAPLGSFLFCTLGIPALILASLGGVWAAPLDLMLSATTVFRDLVGCLANLLPYHYEFDGRGLFFSKACLGACTAVIAARSVIHYGSMRSID
jgi:ComEC/Rec2-related protein